MGANRLASNSLLEVLVFSKRIIEKSQIRAEQPAPNTAEGDCHRLGKRPVMDDLPLLNLANLQSLLWDEVGILRSGME